MADREKVIKGLHKCTEKDFDCGVKKKECPYYYWYEAGTGTCIDILMADALALLKAEEDTRLTPRKPYHTKVKYATGSHWITDQCPECVERGELGIWDTLVDRHVKYCRRCGQALDWSEYNDRNEIDWDEYMSHVNERAKRMAERRRSWDDDPERHD